MNKAFKYRLYPSKCQERWLAQTLETCRRWYNECLAERKYAWDEAQHSVGKYSQLRAVKHHRANNPYAATVHSHALQVVVQDLQKAFDNFFRRVKLGEKPGYPRFKGKNRFDSFGFKEAGNGFKIDGRRLRVTGIGRIPIRWHRSLEGTVKTLRLCRHADKWYVVFTCEVVPKPLPVTNREVGVDVGIHHLLATSDGDFMENPKWYRASARKLRIVQRQVARRTKGGSNRRKSVLQLQRCCEHTANQRKDFLNKEVHRLITHYDRIALEDLQISNMVHNRYLAKSILDAGWGYLRQRLASKAEEAGRTVVFVDPAYTSKQCMQCGKIWEGLTLKDRVVRCECGLEMDRDQHAACNILERAGRARWSETWPEAASVPQEAVGL